VLFSDADFFAIKGDNSIFVMVYQMESEVYSIHCGNLHDSFHEGFNDPRQGLQWALDVINGDPTGWYVESELVERCGYCREWVIKSTLQPIQNCMVCECCALLYHGRSEVPWQKGK